MSERNKAFWAICVEDGDVLCDRGSHQAMIYASRKRAREVLSELKSGGSIAVRVEQVSIGAESNDS